MATGSGSGSAASDPWAAPTKPDDKVPAIEPKDPLPHPLFWSIEKDGKTTYVLGTFHLGVDAENRLPKTVWAKLDAAPALAVEADIGDLGAVADMIRKDGGTLHADLGDAYWKKLEAVISPAVAKQVDHMKPMVASTFLAMHGIDATTPAMDATLVGRAQLEHKDMIYLEAAGKQMAILEKFMNVRALKMMLDHGPESEANLKALLAAYLAGDDTKIVQLSDDDSKVAKESGFTDKEIAEQNDELLYNRNASWIDAIEKAHARGNVFVAVGTMHLLGPKSVLELLKAKGYKITRL